MIRSCCVFFLMLCPAEALKIQEDDLMNSEPHCSTLQGINKEFCLQTFGARKEVHMQEYKSWRADCDFTDQNPDYTIHTITHTLSPNGKYFALNRDWKATESPKATLKTCHKDLGKDGLLHIFKVGPLLTQGDKDRWQRYQINNVFPQYNGKTRGIAGYLQIPVDESGEVLGRPPIHIHHNHLADAQCSFWKIKGREAPLDVEETREAIRGFHVWADTHGDKQCLKSMGGTNCLFRRFPTGWAMPMTLRKGGCFFADYVDERPAGAPPLTWYVENSILIHPPAQSFKRVGVYYMGAGGGDGFGGEYTIDTRNQSITWGTHHFMHDGRVVQVLKHTHAPVSDDGWLVRGDAKALGLPDMNLMENHQDLDTQRNIAPQLDTMKLQLHRRIEALAKKGEAELVCTYSSQGNTLEDVDGDLVDRLTQVPCAGFKFHKNEKFIFISFHKLQDNFKEKFKNIPKMGMHSTFYVFTQANDPNESEDTMIKGDGPVEEQRVKMIEIMGRNFQKGWVDLSKEVVQ